MNGKFTFPCGIGFAALLAMATPAAAQRGPAPVPPSPDQATVDCAAPTTYAVDSEICGDATLRAENSRMQDLLRGYDWQRPPQGSLIESQYDWFRRRAQCAFRGDRRACVRDAYAERNDVLEAVRRARPDYGRTARCDRLPWSNGAQVLVDARQAILFDRSGAVKAVAFYRPRSTWRPFVTLEQSTRTQLRLRGPSGTIRCSIGHTPRPPVRPQPPVRPERPRPVPYGQ